MLKGLIFDFDGVIVDSEPLRYKTYVQLFRDEFGVKLSKSDTSIIGKSTKKNMLYFIEKFNLESDVEYLNKKREGYISKAFADPKSVVPIKGVTGFVKEVSKKYPLAIGSNSKRNFCSSILKKLGLENYFSVFITGETSLPKKPEPAIFLEIAKKLNLKPSECVVFEDSPAGVEASKRAGMVSVAIMSTFSKEELKGADLFVNDFTEIKLEQLKQLF